MLKNALLTILLAVIVAAIVGCNDKRVAVRKALLEFESGNIVFPEKLLKVEGVALSFDTLPSATLLRYVLYYGPEDCSECAISHLMEKSAIFDMADEMGSFVPIIVFSPVPEKAEELRNSLIQRAHTFLFT